MLTVSITGALSSGKSTLASFFKNKGAYVVNADAIAHKLLESNSTCKKQIINLFGPSILNEPSTLRKKLAKIVFENKEKKEALQEILWPLIRKTIKKESSIAQNQGYTLFAAEVPLLFQANWQNDFDYTIVLSSKKELRKVRSFDDFEQREASIAAPLIPSNDSIFWIENNGTLGELEKKADLLFEHLTKLEKQQEF